MRFTLTPEIILRRKRIFIKINLKESNFTTFTFNTAREFARIVSSTKLKFQKYATIENDFITTYYLCLVYSFYCNRRNHTKCCLRIVYCPFCSSIHIEINFKANLRGYFPGMQSSYSCNNWWLYRTVTVYRHILLTGCTLGLWLSGLENNIETRK